MAGLVAGCARALGGEIGFLLSQGLKLDREKERLPETCAKSKSMTWQKPAKCDWARGSPCAQAPSGELELV